MDTTHDVRGILNVSFQRGTFCIGTFTLDEAPTLPQYQGFTLDAKLFTDTPPDKFELLAAARLEAYKGQPQLHLLTWRLANPNIYLIQTLGSGIIARLGPKSAEKIIAKWGEDFVLHMNVDELMPVLGKKKRGPVEEMVASWENGGHQQFDSYLAAARLGLTPQQIQSIKDEMIDRWYERLCEDPYAFVDVLGLSASDAVARRQGIPLDAPQRIQAGFVDALHRAARDGHTAVQEKNLRQNAARTIGAIALKAPITHPEVRQEGDLVGRRRFADIEAELVEDVKRRMAHARPLSLSITVPEWLSANQADAVRRMTAPVSVISGAAGTGKTTILKSIVQNAERNGYSCRLMAPTGAAALRMAAATNHPASTIHMALLNTVNVFEETFILIDEASMLSSGLLLQVLRRTQNDSRIVLIGDANQIPGIEPGQPLRDLVNRVPTTGLTRIFRHDHDGGIASNGAHMLKGEPLESNAQTRLINLVNDNPDTIARTVRELFVNGLARDTMVVTGYRSVVESLNLALQDLFCAGPFRRLSPNQNFGIGDPVRQTRNDYQAIPQPVMNGQIGTVVNLDPLVVNFAGLDTVYETYLQWRHLTLAYAITGHASQGSQWRQVLTVIPYRPGNTSWLVRELPYTMITRAVEYSIVAISKAAQAHYLTAASRSVRQTFIPFLWSTIHAQ